MIYRYRNCKYHVPLDLWPLQCQIRSTFKCILSLCLKLYCLFRIENIYGITLISVDTKYSWKYVTFDLWWYLFFKLTPKCIIGSIIFLKRELYTYTHHSLMHGLRKAKPSNACLLHYCRPNTPGPILPQADKPGCYALYI